MRLGIPARVASSIRVFAITVFPEPVEPSIAACLASTAGGILMVFPSSRRVPSNMPSISDSSCCSGSASKDSSSPSDSSCCSGSASKDSSSPSDSSCCSGSASKDSSSFSAGPPVESSIHEACSSSFLMGSSAHDSKLDGSSSESSTSSVSPTFTFSSTGSSSSIFPNPHWSSAGLSTASSSSGMKPRVESHHSCLLPS